VGHLPGLAAYCAALLLTLLVEVPLYALLLRTTAKMTWWQGARLGAAANLVSHPLVFLVAAPLLAPRLGPVVALVCAEALAVTIEVVVVRALRRQDLVTLAGTSYVANAVSFCAGVLVLAR
jgi:hypothetical protein